MLELDNVGDGICNLCARRAAVLCDERQRILRGIIEPHVEVLELRVAAHGQKRNAGFSPTNRRER